MKKRMAMEKAVNEWGGFGSGNIIVVGNPKIEDDDLQVFCITGNTRINYDTFDDPDVEELYRISENWVANTPLEYFNDIFSDEEGYQMIEWAKNNKPELLSDCEVDEDGDYDLSAAIHIIEEFGEEEICEVCRIDLIENYRIYLRWCF